MFGMDSYFIVSAHDSECLCARNVLVIQLKKAKEKSNFSCQGVKGHWTVYHASLQKFYDNGFLFVGLTTLGISTYFD